MALLRDLPIRSKLQAVIMVTCVVALILAGLTFFAHELINEKRAMARDLTTLADIIGANSIAPLSFIDRSAARDTLAALRADERVLAAYLFADEDQLFASFAGQSEINDDPLERPPPEAITFDRSRVLVSRPIFLDTDRIGTIVVEADLDLVYTKLGQLGTQTAGILAICLLVAWAMSSMLARVFSKPLLSLTETASRISAEGDYSARAQRMGRDELGQLVDRFNEMLEQIALRDAELKQARHRLAERVEERTRKLRRREWWLTTILRGMDEGVIAADPVSRVTFVNEAAEKLTGLSRESAVGSPFERVLKLKDPVEICFSEEEIASGDDTPRLGRAILVDAVGLENPIEYSATVMPREPDGKEGTVVVFRDISTRLEAEQAIALQRLQALVENLPEGIAILSPEWRLSLVNPPAAEYLDYLAGAGVGDALETLAGQPARELLTHGTGDEWQQLDYGGPPERTFEIIATAIEGGGMILGYALVLREITAELETRRQLQQQDRLAAVGQLAAGIAHDLNNMLQAVTGYAELIRIQGGLPDKVQQRVEGIISQGSRGARLIRQILDFSRKSITERQPLDLAPFLAEVVRMLRATIPENVHIRTDFSSGPCRALVDPTQMQQLVTNLAVNARDAMPTGGELTIRLSLEDLEQGSARLLSDMPSGTWVCLAISDAGAGIPAEAQPKVFEPFFTTKDRGEGTGLGLSQVYGIVKQQDGFIDFESEPDRGTTFFIYLKPVTEEAARIEASGEFLLPRPSSSNRILVVEDEPMVLGMTREILEAYGFEVVTATTGGQALKLFANDGGRIDLVLSDMVMPEMGGLELSRKLRELDPEIRVVLMSGYPLGEDVKEELETGRLRWIAKPYSAKQLGSVVSACLSG